MGFGPLPFRQIVRIMQKEENEVGLHLRWKWGCLHFFLSFPRSLVHSFSPSLFPSINVFSLSICFMASNKKDFIIIYQSSSKLIERFDKL